MRRRLLAAVCVSVLAGCAGLQQGGRPSTLTESDIISPSLVPVACLGAMKGTPIYSGASRQSFLLGYTGAQVASTGQTSQGFTNVLFRRDQPGWVPSEATGSFGRPGFPTVRCSVAGIRTDGGPVFFYH
jgi:hypothetical protein